MTSNPFEPPKSDVSTDGLPASIQGYSPDEIKKLYYRSSNVNGIAFFMAIGAAVTAFALSNGAKEPLHTKLFYGSLLLFCSLATVGTIRREPWGRTLGIIACTLSLINIPLGTIIGAIGLTAFIKAKELFGPGRIKHSEVKAAYNALNAKG